MKEQIHQYINVVTEIKSSVMDLQSSKYAENHKRTLMLSLLDMMSKVTAEKGLNNRGRFVNFINEFCGWKYSEYVSLPQLKFLIDREKGKELDKIRTFIEERMEKWPLGEPVKLEYDAKYEAVEALWPGGFKMMGKISLKQLRHCELLWTYRNSYVHEMRPPGQVYKLYNIETPHYTQIFPLKWELVYPYTFLLEMVDHAICNIKRYLEKNKINPFDRYKFEYSWLQLR